MDDPQTSGDDLLLGADDLLRGVDDLLRGADDCRMAAGDSLRAADGPSQGTNDRRGVENCVFSEKNWVWQKRRITDY